MINSSRFLAPGIVALCIIVALLAALGGSSHAQVESSAQPELMEPEGLNEPTATPEEVASKPLGAMSDLVSAIRSGNWRIVAAIALSLIMLAGAKARDKIAFFKGDRGGIVAIFTLSAVGALATSLFADGAIDATMFLRAAEVGLLAIGGFVGFKKLVWPSDKKAA